MTTYVDEVSGWIGVTHDGESGGIGRSSSESERHPLWEGEWHTVSGQVMWCLGGWVVTQYNDTGSIRYMVRG